MSVIGTRIDTGSAEFKANAAAMGALVKELRGLLATARQGGSAAAVAKHRARGKLLPRERIARVLDAGAPFLELSALAGHDVYTERGRALATPSAGVVTGIGSVHGRPCMFVANDATVKGGAYFPLTVKKHVRAQRIAAENRLPCVYLVDSGGAYLPLQRAVFPDAQHFGRIFCSQARLSAAGVPQIAAVLGSCTAGGAYVPAMADESVIVRGNGTVFLGGPPLVAAATGERVTAEQLGGADLHCRTSGVTDHYAETEEQALAIVRQILQHSVGNNFASSTSSTTSASPPYEPVAPKFSETELDGLVPRDARRHMDAKEVIARIVDGSVLHEFKALYAPSIVTGFARVGGHPVGVVANNGVLFSESAAKAAHFVQLCDRRATPLLFFQNITGFMVGRQAEAGGIARHGAKLVTAVACARVPKLTVVTGASYGAGNYAMCGRAYDPRFLFMWPNARIAVMGGEQAASVLATVSHRRPSTSTKDKNNKDSSSIVQQQQQQIRDKYAKESSALFSTARLWDDGIIEPRDTRTVLTLALNAIRAGAHTPPPPATRYGIFRM